MSDAGLEAIIVEEGRTRGVLREGMERLDVLEFQEARGCCLQLTFGSLSRGLPTPPGMESMSRTPYYISERSIASLISKFEPFRTFFGVGKHRNLKSPTQAPRDA